MGKKKKRKKNPLLQQKYHEGFQAGYERGMQDGISRATAFFATKFSTLEEEKGIGPKTIEKVKRVLGEKYFYK